VAVLVGLESKEGGAVAVTVGVWTWSEVYCEFIAVAVLDGLMIMEDGAVTVTAGASACWRT